MACNPECQQQIDAHSGQIADVVGRLHGLQIDCGAAPLGRLVGNPAAPGWSYIYDVLTNIPFTAQPCISVTIETPTNWHMVPARPQTPTAIPCSVQGWANGPSRFGISIAAPMLPPGTMVRWIAVGT